MGYVQDKPYSAGQSLEEPDMGYRRGKLDISHTLSSDFLSSNLYPTAITHNSFVFYALIFTTSALPVFLRAKYCLTKQTILFGSESSVIDGLRFLHLSAGTVLALARRAVASGLLCPLFNLFRGGDPYANGIKVLRSLRTSLFNSQYILPFHFRYQPWYISSSDRKDAGDSSWLQPTVLPTNLRFE